MILRLTIRFVVVALLPQLAVAQRSPAEDVLVYEQSSNQWFEGPATRMALSPDGEWALFSSWGRGVRLVSLKTRKEDAERVRSGLDSLAEDGAFCGKGGFAWLGRRGSVHAWFLSRGRDLQQTSVSSDALLQCSPDGSEIAYWFPYGGPEDGLFVGPVGKLQKYQVPGRVTGVAFSADDKLLYASVFKPNGESLLIRVTCGKSGDRKSVV